MATDSVYNIVLVANEEYVQHAGVMLTSLFSKNKGRHFRVFFLTDGISHVSQHRLEVLCSSFNSRLSIYEPEKNLLSNGRRIDIKSLNAGRWNPMIFYKLFIPSILPQDVDRCLFLDADMVINNDIAELYNINLCTNVIGGVEDSYIFEHKSSLGLDPQNDCYINSGVMVCDIKKWRELEKVSPIFDFTLSVRDIIHNEQDVLALYFKGAIKYLPFKWNVVGWYYFRDPFFQKQPIPEILEARSCPGIIHYCLCVQPWFSDSDSPHAYAYIHYLKKYASVAGFKPDLNFPRKNAVSVSTWIRTRVYKLLNDLNIRKDLMHIVSVEKINLQ